MPRKSVKIDIDGTLTEVDNLFEDEDYKKMNSHDCWALHVPMMWEHKKFCLTLVCKGIFEPPDRCNFRGDLLYEYLYSNNGKPRNTMREPVWILNEEGNETIDMTIEDMKYIFEKIEELIIAERDKIDELIIAKGYVSGGQKETDLKRDEYNNVGKHVSIQAVRG